MRDDFDTLVADRCKILDDVPVPDTWSRVLDRVPVRDAPSRAPFSDDALTMIDLDTPAPPEPRHQRPHRAGVAALLAAAVVAAIVLVSTRDDAQNPADEPAPTVTAPSTAPPGDLFGTPVGERLAPGTYFIDEVNGTPTPRISFTLGAGWSRAENGKDRSDLSQQGPTTASNTPEDAIGFIAFSRPEQVYLDACHLNEGFHPGPVTTLDGLVTALTEQQGGWHVTAAPSDISVDGYPGKTFKRTAPAVFTDCSKMSPTGMRIPEVGGGVLRSWLNGDNASFGGAYYEPGQVETLLVLDLDGTIVVINTSLFPGPTIATRTEFAAALDSIRIDRE